VNNSLDVNENDEHAPDLALRLSALNRACHSHARVQLVLPYPSACLIIARSSVPLFPRFTGNVYADSRDMLVLSSTVASRYYNCCTDSSTSPGNYGRESPTFRHESSLQSTLPEGHQTHT
jgi:hypothetical protein